MSERSFADINDLCLKEFEALCSRSTSAEDFPGAAEICQSVVIYQGETLRRASESEDACRVLKSELQECLKNGPGVLVVRDAWPDSGIVESATAVFRRIIREEATRADQRGDHFAAPGENERLWNALQKFCEHDAERFVEYYDNPVLGLVSEAWLGPCFQVTSQVNIVKPGGSAQKPHRDYHLGFQDDAVVSRFPVSLQTASQFLTLQGAVAHTDMSPQSGSTKLLPWSQLYPLGYLAWRQPEFVEFFEANSVQLPLRQGDAVFFSPALFHAAGTNSEATDRIANLLQVSAAFGRTMESVDWPRLARLTYPVLLDRQSDVTSDTDALRWLGGSLAEGYSFPTNLDTDPPLSGSAPQSAQQLMARALQERWSPDQFNAALDTACRRRQP